MSPANPSYDRIAFVASPIPEAQAARERLAAHYGDVPPDEADVIVALGGDGFMLQTLHQFMRSGRPIYGMHRGTVGFLMNEFHEKELRDRLRKADTTVIHPLLMCARDSDGTAHEYHAFNEVSLFRESIRPRAYEFWSTARSVWRSWSPTACCWPPRRARPPTICRRKARSFRSMRRCWP